MGLRPLCCSILIICVALYNIIVPKEAYKYENKGEYMAVLRNPVCRRGGCDVDVWPPSRMLSLCRENLYCGIFPEPVALIYFEVWTLFIGGM